MPAVASYGPSVDGSGTVASNYNTWWPLHRLEEGCACNGRTKREEGL